MSERLLRMAVVALLTAVGPGFDPGSASSQDWRTVTSARQLWGTEPVKVRIEYGAGRLEVGSAAKGTLYRMETRYDQNQVAPLSTFSEESRTLHLGIRSREGRRGKGSTNGSRASVALTREVPIDLDLDFGAGEAKIDLGGLRLQRVDLSTGASETKVRFDQPNPIRATLIQINAGAADLEVRGLGNAHADRIEFSGGVGSTVLDFSGAWQGHAAASVRMGIGSVVLRLPRSLGIRVDRSSFLTSFDAAGLVRRDGSYFSTNWGSARNRLTIDVEAALGSIEIDWVD
ncbi:MAG: hypothetical protein KY464_01130 [Gemmatimonadetes bacterium]|nr:hypothetical protein [Gemmatimonadota bacterium]